MGLLLSGNALAQSQSLVVVIRNVKEARGKVSVALFTGEKDFMKNRLAGKSVEAKNGDVEVMFEDLVPGEYAISVMHDENENGELDSNLIGIPKEGFGFSNDAMGMFGPPTFEKAKFKWSGGEQKQIITLRYL